jgi:hypothetical protein
MNIKYMIYSLLFLIGCNSFSASATSTGDMLAYELLRARQMCERSHPRRVCLEMEQMRYKELQEGIREESKTRHHERDRDNRSEDQRRRYDREDADVQALRCRHHPKMCESHREEIDERMTQQQWCERYYTRRQCLEMYEESQWQRKHQPPEPPISQHRPRTETSREQRRSRDIERSETPPARIIERPNNRLPENDNRRDPPRRNSENRESGR